MEKKNTNLSDKIGTSNKLNNMRRLVEITNIINSTLDINNLLITIMEMIKEIMETDTSTLFLYEEETGDLVFKVVLAKAGRELQEKSRVKIGQGIAGWVAKNKKIIYINDVYNDERFDPSYDKQTGYISKSILCAPLLYKDKLLGVIQAINPIKKEYFDDQDDIELFEAFANQAAIALENASLYANLEKKVAERTSELAEANKKLKDLDIAKTNFFANISHELRTPLTLILSPIEAIIQGDYGNNLKNDDDILNSVYENGIRLLKLINNLLDFSKIEAGKMSLKRRKSDISKLIRHYSSSVISTAENIGLTIKFVDNTDGVITWVDQNLFEKAVFNLISNALKFTPAGGLIDVQLDGNKDKFNISIKDTGIGIPRDKLNTIFERFSQVDSSLSRQYSGTGIGLSFAKEIIELHKGTIEVESELGKGSVFTISMPILNSPDIDHNDSSDGNGSFISNNNHNIIGEINPYLWEDRGDVMGSPSLIKDDKAYQPKKKRTILIVDDSLDMLKFLHTLLNREYNVFSAINGKEALQKLSKGDLKPDLVIADIMMPEMDGYELTEAIRSISRLEGLPIILLTAKADIPMKVKGIKKGANDYIVKPFNPKELLARVDSQIELKILRDRLIEANRILKQTLEDSSILVSNFGHKIFHELWPFAKMIMVGSRLIEEIEVNNVLMDKDDLDFARETIAKCEGSLERFEIMKEEIKRNFGKRSDKIYNKIKYILEDILNDFKEIFIDNNITLETNLDLDSTREIKINSEQIQIALENLLNNAVHALNTIGENKNDKKIIINASFSGEDLLLTIEDNGPGIPEEARKKIYDMFYSHKDNGSDKGVGLGLFITRWIIEDCHKGTIEVDSKVGKFTKFAITLPTDGDFV
ncbi:MAG: ATP-binding protein [Spirochaetota bacterium]|nr:ATP-binding protein [Spirochaetota bacterium]